MITSRGLINASIISIFCLLLLIYASHNYVDSYDVLVLYPDIEIKIIVLLKVIEIFLSLVFLSIFGLLLSEFFSSRLTMTDLPVYRIVVRPVIIVHLIILLAIFWGSIISLCFNFTLQQNKIIMLFVFLSIGMGYYTDTEDKKRKRKKSLKEIELLGNN